MIGESAGSVYVSIFGDNKPLAKDLQATDALIRRHAAAMAGLQLFKPGLFTSQMSGLLGMARGSGVLYSQLNMMAGLAPKLGALASPFLALKGVMAGMQNVFNPGNILKSAVATQTTALATARKVQEELQKRVGYTPSQAAAAKHDYQDEVAKATAKVERETTRAKKALDGENVTIEKQTAALAKLKAAEDALTAAKEKQAAEIKRIDSQIKGNAITPAQAHAKLAPYVKAVHDAHAQVKAAQGTSKLDIMGGGAVSALMNVIGGVVSAGKIVWGVASSIFSVFKGIFNAVASVAHAIVNVLGEAFSFLKNLAVHTFQVVSVAAMAVGTALVAGLRSAFEKGKDLLNAFAQTGIRVKEALIIETAASMTGVDKENIATQINRMQRAISGIDKEGPKIKNALQALGIDLAKLQAMSPTDQMTAIANGLAKISDPAQRAGVAINIFSVRGSQMISMMLQMAEAIKLSKQQWGQAGEAFDKNKDKFAYIARSIEGITQVKIPSFFAGIATPLANTLSWLSDKLNAFDPFKSGFKIGAKIDEYLRLIIGAFQKGRLMEWLGLELKVAFKEAVNYLVAGLMIAGDVLSSILHIEGFLPLIGEGLGAAFGVAVGTFLQAFQGVLPELGAGIGWVVDKLIQGLKYAKNIFLGGGIGALLGGGIGATVAIATGNPELAPLAWKGGALAGGALGASAAGYFGVPDESTHFQDTFRKEAVDVNMPGRASGGPVTGGRPVLVGEKGPEVFVPHGSGEVIPNHMLRHLANGTPGASEYSKHDWLAESAARAKAAKKSSDAVVGESRFHFAGIDRTPAFPTVSISKIGLGPSVKSSTQETPLVFKNPAWKAAFDKMEAERKQTSAQKMVANNFARLNEVMDKLAQRVDFEGILKESVSKRLHPNQNAEATKEQLVKERDTFVAKQKALQDQIENPRARDNANAMLAKVKQQIASKKNQIDSGDLSPRAEEQAKYDLAKLQEQEAYQQAKVNEQKSYNQSTGADDAQRRKIKKLQRQIEAKEKEIDEVQGLGPRDVMGVRADKDRLAALKKQLIAQGLVGTGGKPFDVPNQPEPGRAGVASGFAGTMSGFSAGRIMNFAHSKGGTAVMEGYLKNIETNTAAMKNAGYGP